MSRRIPRLGRAALAAVCLVLGCGGPQDETSRGAASGPETIDTTAEETAEGPPERGDWLVLHLLSDPENLNPVTASDAGASQVLNWIFQSLLTIDPETLEQRPVLARSLPKISDDHLTYTFTLRDDINFADGTPLTAEDVVFTAKVIRNPKVAAPHLRNYYDSVRNVVAVDAHTVRFDLREPYFRNEWTLGSLDVLPRHYYDPEDLLSGIGVADLNAWEDLSPEQQERARRFAKQFNTGYQRRPMGSGAYVLADPKRDFVTGQQIVLRHRDNFWAPDDTDLGDGWFDRIVFRIINDREAAFVALKAGDLDVIGLTPIQAVRQAGTERFQERFGKQAEIRGAYTYVGWNQRRKIFQDPRVRRALSHLVDKRNLVDKVMLGLAEPVEGPVFNKRPEYRDALEPWEYSPAKAKALLAEAGWEDTDGDGILDKEIDGERVPLRFELISNAGNDERKKVGLAVIDSFKKNGIDASFRSVDWSILLDKVSHFDYDAVVLGWTSGGAAIPPDGYQIWHSSQAVEDGSNHVAFVNEEVDGILEAYRVEFDPEQRNRLYDRFQEILYEEQPYTFLYAPSAVTAWDRRFAGVRWYPGIGTRLNEWWVPKDRQRH
ncbi:MAG: ABC transporter substrate-binding protein [Myxococcota bacterium]|nr:ABC transporter substrate-binding protein [Myxococcota bacterium]